MRGYVLSNLMVLLIVSFFGCSENAGNSGSQQLSRSALTVNDDVVVSEAEFEYYSSGKLMRLTQKQENFAILTYEAIYEGEDIIQIIRTSEQLPEGNTNTVIYEVLNEGSKIFLYTDDMALAYEFKVTDSYVDTFKVYLDDTGVNAYTATFNRDEDNNIKEISNYASDQSEVNQFIWSFKYSNFLYDAVLYDGINPVYHYAYNLYNGTLGLMLNLKTSNRAPLICTQKWSTGEIQENLIVAIPTTNEADQVEQLDYIISDLPDNSYQITFEYD